MRFPSIVLLSYFNKLFHKRKAGGDFGQGHLYAEIGVKFLVVYVDCGKGNRKRIIQKFVELDEATGNLTRHDDSTWLITIGITN